MGKKRSRLSKVCDFCKRRKVKCDLGNPCSTCVKYKKSPCVYSETNHLVDQRSSSDELFSSSSNRSSTSTNYSSVQQELTYLKEKILSLENSVTNVSPHEIYSPIDLSSPEKLDSSMMVGHNPYDNDYECYNFYQGYSATHQRDPLKRKNFGPLAWITLLKVDNALSQTWKDLVMIKNEFKCEDIIANDKDATGNNDDFNEKIKNEEIDIKPYRDMEFKQQPPLKKTAISLGLSFYEGGLEQELELVEKIRLVLPKQRVIWLLYKRFFTHLYPAIPFIDEVVFKNQIEKLIGYEDDQEVKVSVKVEKRLDFANLGILLLILRFTYISLFSYDSTINEINFHSNDPSPEPQRIKYLLNNPIGIDLVTISQLCLNQFNTMRNANMTLMQLALLTRMYHHLAPEDGDGIDGGDARVFNATLIQMAMQLGLHREPDPEIHTDEKMNNIGRKIWYYVIIYDFNDALSTGNLLSVAPDSFDTKLPSYKLGNENVIDVEMEKITCSCFPNFETSYEPLYELFNMMFKVKKNVNMKEMAIKLEQLECQFSSKYQGLTTTYDFNLDQMELIPSTLKLKIYFTSNYWLASIYLHIFNYYEAKGSYKLAYYYLKKIFLVVVYEVMPFFCECVSHNRNIFKNSIDLIVTPKFISVAHTSLLVIHGLFIRLRHSAERSAFVNDYRYQLLIKCCDLLAKCRDIFRDCVGRLSHRYYYAWRITKAQNFLSTVMTDDYFRDRFKSDVNLDWFTIDMLREIDFIMENALSKIKPNETNYNTFTAPEVHDFKSNPEVDNVWLQLMNHNKNEPNFNYLNDPISQEFTFDPIDLNQGLFENFPIDELFKDFS